MTSTPSIRSSDTSITLGDGDLIDRPRKRRRTENENLGYSDPALRQLVLEELDVELGLRHRLSETIRSRLTWALLLQETLEKGLTASNEAPDFRDAALDALDALEDPCNILYDRDVTIFQKPMRPVQTSTATTPIAENSASVIPQSTPRTGSSRIRGLPRAPPPPPAKKLLFIRDTSTNPPSIAKLACPDCARTDFAALQGLLNHCRLRHNREYGSHDECMQSCAVLVPEEERDWVVANGTELAGISLPSLRRLFEIAVGGGNHITIPGIQQARTTEEPAKEDNDVSREPSEPVPTSTEVTRTLGYHADTPALAPFLGRAPKKRMINVYEDPNIEIDILSREGELQGRTEGKRGWRMAYNHRNTARSELDEVVQISDMTNELGLHAPEPTIATQLPNPMHQLSNIASSRFHIVARVNVADHSLCPPSDRRSALQHDHIHKWRLSISSPSYSLHITTFLVKLTVTCLTDPPPPTFLEPITVTEPPFVVTSTTDRPFLARLTFTWTGSQNAPMDVEHWVDSDALHLGHPVLGDEQIFDVELDRNTELLPVREDQRKVSWKDEDEPQRKESDKSPGEEEDGSGTVPEYVGILRALLPQVPISTKDVRGRATGHSASHLIPGRAQFRNMVYGRRKAIEMSRARALLEAYEQHVASLPEKGNHTPLTTADVFRWMEDENVFPRTVVKKRTEDAQTSEAATSQGALNPDVYCRICGLSQVHHPGGVEIEEASPQDVKDLTVNLSANSPRACLTFNGPGTRRPVFDVNRLLNPAAEGYAIPYGLSPRLFTPPMQANKVQLPVASPADLLAVAHPQLVIAIRSVSEMWKLEHLQTLQSSVLDSDEGLMSRTEINKPRQEVLDDLAPYATLAVVARSMIRMLVQRGLDVVRQDETAVRMLGKYERAKIRQKISRGQTAAGGRRLLTPSHVLRGLTLGAQRGLAESATLVGIARLGIGKGDNNGRAKVVKMEEEENVRMPMDAGM